MLLKDGSDFEPEQSDIIQWQRCFPHCDVHAELAAMESWCDANPKKRKTPAGVKRFINAWLKRANVARKVVKTRDMSQLDDLTHNFTGDPEVRLHFMSKYGQCFEDGVRYE